MSEAGRSASSAKLTELADVAGLELLASSVLLVDAHGVVCYANAAAEHLLDSSLKALQRQPLAALFINAEELIHLCQQALEHK